MLSQINLAGFAGWPKGASTPLGYPFVPVLAGTWTGATYTLAFTSAAISTGTAAAGKWALIYVLSGGYNRLHSLSSVTVNSVAPTVLVAQLASATSTTADWGLSIFAFPLSSATSVTVAGTYGGNNKPIVLVYTVEGLSTAPAFMQKVEGVSAALTYTPNLATTDLLLGGDNLGIYTVSASSAALQARAGHWMDDAHFGIWTAWNFGTPGTVTFGPAYGLTFQTALIHLRLS